MQDPDRFELLWFRAVTDVVSFIDDFGDVTLDVADEVCEGLADTNGEHPQALRECHTG